MPSLDPSHLVASLAENSEFGLIVFDREYRYLMWNRVMEQISGVAAVEVIGQIAPEIFPFLREGELAVFDEALAGHRVRSEKRPFRTSAGRSGIFQAEYLPVWDSSGAVVAAVGIIRDITELYRAQVAELAFAESESRFRAVADVASSAIYIHDGKRMLYVNKAAEEITGYSLAEILSMDLWALVHPDDLKFVQQRAAERFAGKPVPSRYEYRIVHRSGEPRWVDFSASRVKLGDTPVIVACAFDITERRLAEAALRRSEERYRTLLEQTSEGIWRFDLDPPIAMKEPADKQVKHFFSCAYLAECNDAMARLYGFASADQLIGTRLDRMLIPDDPQNSNFLLSFVQHEYRLVDAESHEIDREGNRKYFLNNLIGIISDGFLVSAWGTQRDITARKQAEEALRHSERLATAGRMAATIAHELNNPLESVTNLIYLLQRSDVLNEPARHYADLAQKELARASHIAKQTLAFYRDPGRAGKLQVGDLITEVIDFYLPRARQSGIAVEFTTRGGEAIEAHAGELKQVFSNILLNAMDAVAKAPGKVHLRSRPALHGPTGRRGVRVTVCDNGPGIPPALRKRIFDAFFTTKGTVGTGLGLWVTAGIVAKHGGTIRLRSSTVPGRSWTCFSIFLPVHSAVPDQFARSA